jgi:hypothetical protein
MTAAQFREIALSFPEAVEAAHMGHPDFRIGGKIFATLGYQNEGRGVLLSFAGGAAGVNQPASRDVRTGSWRLGPPWKHSSATEANNAARPPGCDDEGLAEESLETIEQASASG